MKMEAVPVNENLTHKERNEVEQNTFHNKMKFIITDLKKIEIQPLKCTNVAFIVVLVKANEFHSQLLGTFSDIRKISKEHGEKIDGKLQPL